MSSSISASEKPVDSSGTKTENNASGFIARTRQLCGRNQTCTFGCKFCFAAFSCYSSPSPLTLADQAGELDVLYPICDAEFFQDKNAYAALLRVARSAGPPLIISLSTRCSLNAQMASRLQLLAKTLNDVRGGLVKVSVSISARERLREFEPRASSYSSRLEALGLLQESGIATSVNLKPLLPQVSEEEYMSIVRDTVRFSGVYLLGGLYLDPLSQFGKDTLRAYPLLAGRKRVPWIDGQPIWPYVEDKSKTVKLISFVEKEGGRAFQTDLEIVSYLHAKRR